MKIHTKKYRAYPFELKNAFTIEEFLSCFNSIYYTVISNNQIIDVPYDYCKHLKIKQLMRTSLKHYILIVY